MSLHLTHLTLSHFRSHRLMRMTCEACPVAIYGPNGAGKTNILEAISLLSPGRGLRRASAEDMARRPEALGWKIRADMVSLHQTHDVQTWAEPGTTRQVTIDGKASPQVALGRVARVLWLIPSMDRLWIEGADGRRRFLDRMTLSFEPDHAETVLAYEKAMRERNRLLKDQVRDARWYDALEVQMAEHGARIHRNRQDALNMLAQSQREAQTEFPTALLDLAYPEPSCETPEDANALQAAFSEHRVRDMAAGRTLIGPHRVDLDAVYASKDMTARECSTGEQKALLVSLVLANARALAESFGAPPILLLDEIAAHLDADRRAALYDEICALGAQAWMTGTGAELFVALGDRAHYVEVTEIDGVSQIREGNAE